MAWPLLLPLVGAGIGAGIGAAAGPDDEPLWKKMLVGGALGGVAGLGVGAAGVGAPAAAVAAPGAASAPVVGTATTYGVAGALGPGGIPLAAGTTTIPGTAGLMTTPVAGSGVLAQTGGVSGLTASSAGVTGSGANAALGAEFTAANYGTPEAALRASQAAAHLQAGVPLNPSTPGTFAIPSVESAGSWSGAPVASSALNPAATTATTPVTFGGELTAEQGAANLGLAPGGNAANMFGGIGSAMANHPFYTAGGLGVAGMLALPGGDDDNGRQDAEETYPQDSSWEARRQRPLFYGSRSLGGIGRSFYS